MVNHVSRIILIVLLSCNTLYAGYEEGDPTSCFHEPESPYYGLYTDNGYLDASYGELVTSEQYDTAKAAYNDGLGDFELQFNKLLKAFAFVVLDEVNILRVNDGLNQRTKAQLKQAVKNKYNEINGG